MTYLIDKDALVAEIERRLKFVEIRLNRNNSYTEEGNTAWERDKALYDAYKFFLSFINTLEVINPYEQCIQYPTVKDGIEAHAEVYSFNIESELFNQLTKEQQKLWRKEIEQACISGGNAGYLLARDPRYKENLEVKEVDLEKEIDLVEDKYHGFYSLSRADVVEIIKHFFELGVRVNNPITAADRGTAEEIIINLKKVEQDYRINLTREMEWLRNKVQKGD